MDSSSASDLAAIRSSNRRTKSTFRRGRLSSTTENDIETISRWTSASQIQWRQAGHDGMSILASDKIDKLVIKSKTPARARRAGVLNYAFLTLVGKGDTKSRHPKILIVAAVPRSELNRSVHNGGAGKG